MAMRRWMRDVADRSPGLLAAYRTWRDERDRRRPPMATPWGFTLAGLPGAASGRFEPEETALVRRLLLDVDVLVNAGANVGYYCCHALSLGRAVVAIEPLPANVAFLLANLDANGWSDRVEVFPVALGARHGILPLWGGGTGASLIPGWAGAGSAEVTRVPVLSLDRLLGHRLAGQRALVLVDVEGAELDLLAGAVETAARDPRPIWLVEIALSEHQPAAATQNPKFGETFEWFFARGYAAVTADATARPVTSADVAAAVRGDQILPTHNFLFR